MKEGKWLWVLRRLALAIITTVVILIVYSTMMNVRTLKVSLYSAVLSTALLLCGWLASAIRLRYLVKVAKPGMPCPFTVCIKARFVGDILAKATPSAIGGEPARAYYISTSTGLSFLEAYALTMFEVFFDVIFTCITGALFSLWFLPLSLPVLISSLATGTAWILTFSGIGRVADFATGSLEKLLSRCARGSWIHRYVHKIATKILEFKDHYITISSRLSVKQKGFLWAFTALIHVMWSISIIPLLVNDAKHGTNVLAFFWSAMSAYCLMQSISILPTPGGSGVAEYGLSIVLPPDVVVQYRALYFFVPILIGLPFYLEQLRNLN